MSSTLPHHLAELADVAAKATPGPWLFVPDTTGSYWVEGADRERRGYGAVALAYNSNNDENDAKHIAAFNPRTAGALVEIAEAATVVRNWMVTTGHCNGDSHWQYRGLAEALEKLEALAGLGEK